MWGPGAPIEKNNKNTFFLSETCEKGGIFQKKVVFLQKFAQASILWIATPFFFWQKNWTYWKPLIWIENHVILNTSSYLKTSDPIPRPIRAPKIPHDPRVKPL